MIRLPVRPLYSLYSLKPFPIRAERCPPRGHMPATTGRRLPKWPRPGPICPGRARAPSGKDHPGMISSARIVLAHDLIAEQSIRAHDVVVLHCAELAAEGDLVEAHVGVSADEIPKSSG